MRPRARSSSLLTALRACCAVVAGLFLLALAGIVSARALYPFQLEWMEGGSVDHVRRILAGDALYVKPGFDFIPYAYPPLYYYLSSLVARATGLGLLPLRLVSIAATATTFFLLHALVRRETGDRLAAFVAVGIFAASFPLSGAWMDLARVDPLYLCGFCAALWFLRRPDLDPSGLRAGTCFALAFLVKQIALPMSLPCLLYELRRDARRGAAILVGTGLLAGAASLALVILSDGWYAYYVFQLPPERFASQFQVQRIPVFWMQHVLARLPILSALAIWSLWHEWRRDRDSALFLSMLTLGMVGTSWWSCLEETAYDNNLLPFHLCLGLLAGVALGRASEPGRRGAGSASLAVGALLLLQLLLLGYDPRVHVPSREDRAAGRSLERRLSASAAELVMTHRPFLPGLAEAPITAHIHAINDVLRGDEGPASRDLERELVGIFGQRRVRRLLVDEGWWFASEDINQAIQSQYRVSERLFDDDSVFWTRTGMASRPAYLLVPIESAP